MTATRYLVKNPIKILTTVLVAAIIQPEVYGQSCSYTVNKTLFSTDNFDEFAPAYYKGGLVFCSDRSPGLSLYSNSLDERTYSIFHVDKTGDNINSRVKLLSKDLTSRLNDGPVTFSPTGDTIFYSRNLYIEGKLSDLSTTRNKLGVFYSVQKDGQWTVIRDLRFNNQWHNTTTPFLSPDGRKLYFSSDMPGGYGGFDLYYSELQDGYWGDPVNLGPAINTTGNEIYPFINAAGELLFSSDGHPGMGGLDIFYSRLSNSGWNDPIRLDHPINSRFDDFGIITDALMNEGFFSSNRDGTSNIYHFKTDSPQIFHEDIQQDNQYCFTFSDRGRIDINDLYLQYIWSFGDGNTAEGAEVNHCYSGPGSYSVRLDAVERSSGNLFFTKLQYNLELKNRIQPYIKSPDVALSGKPVEFDGTGSFIPGYQIIDYFWDFEYGNRASGEKVSHTFIEEGDFFINLGLTIKSEETENILKTGVSKKISILKTRQEKESYIAKKDAIPTELPDIRDFENAVISSLYSAENKIQKDAVFAVEVLSSKTRIGLDNIIFRRLPNYYRLRERFDKDNQTYNYTVDQQLNLMSTYLAYRNIKSLGFKGSRVIVTILEDQFERELYNLIKIYGNLVDIYFDRSNNLTSNAYMMLDQVIKLMDSYPSARLEIAVHSDDTGTPDDNLRLTQMRAKILTNYLINRGISSNRLIPSGMGNLKPVAPNIRESDRLLNRRIELNIIKQ